MTSPGSQSKNKNHKPGSLSLDWTRITKYHNVDHYTTTVFIYIRQNYFVCLSYLPDTCVRLRDKMELLIWQFAKENVSFCSERQVAEWQYIVSLSLSLFHFPFLCFTFPFFLFFTSPLQNCNILSPIIIYIKFVWFSHSFCAKITVSKQECHKSTSTVSL